MKLLDKIKSATQSFFTAVARLFSPTDDRYPETGVQPFTGDPYKEKQGAD